MLKIGSLFSGYGGLDMAVEQVLDAEPAWFVEYDKAPSKILTHHWPDVPNYGDVTSVDWATMPPVDILTGGYPCQPFSQAGQRKGTTDERHLWPYVREAIRALRPQLTILENVAGHRSLGFDRVLGDMAEDGLHVRWTSIRASGIGAPHHRERLFIVVSADGLFDPRHDAGRSELGVEHAITAGGAGEPGQDVPDTEGTRRDHGEASDDGTTNREKRTPGDDSHATTDPEGERLSRQQQPSRGSKAVTGTDSRFGTLPNTDGERRDGRGGSTRARGSGTRSS